MTAPIWKDTEATLPAKEGDLRVWWIPQIPMRPFCVRVDDLDQAALLLDTLASYDLFQLAHNIKPDFSNTGGLEIFEDGEWMDWCDEESGDDFDSYRRKEDQQ